MDGSYCFSETNEIVLRGSTLIIDDHPGPFAGGHFIGGDILIGGQFKLMDSVDVETPVGRWTYWISNRWSRTVTSAGGQWVKRAAGGSAPVRRQPVFREEKCKLWIGLPSRRVIIGHKEWGQ
jgi:hypothetical protein